MGDVRLADVLVAPSPDDGNAVFRLADWSAVGRWAADREMKVSTHFAVLNQVLTTEIQDDGDGSQLTNDGLLIFAAVLQLEQLSSAQSKDHALIIFLQMIVYLRSN